MKLSTITLATLMTLATTTAFSAHRGGNGGDDTEMYLKKTMQQVGIFLNSTVGKKEFKMINPESINESINQTQIQVISDKVLDKNGEERTCTNEAPAGLITCNLERINNLLAEDKEDILIGMMFHEILGINGLELGDDEVISRYPISSKILSYSKLVSNTEILEKDVRPEYYGLDNRSYGLTVVNDKTKETLRMICLNDNVEIFRCKNFSVVRKLNDMQIPINKDVSVLKSGDIKWLNFTIPSIDELRKINEELIELRKKGFKFLTIGAEADNGCDSYNSKYRYGFGLQQKMADNFGGCNVENFVLINTLGIFMFGMGPVTLVADTTFEAVKQIGNILIYPFKALFKGSEISSLKKQRKMIEKRVDLMKQILNTENDLSLVNKQVSLSNEEFGIVQASLKQIVAQPTQF